MANVWGHSTQEPTLYLCTGPGQTCCVGRLGLQDEDIETGLDHPGMDPFRGASSDEARRGLAWGKLKHVS